MSLLSRPICYQRSDNFFAKMHFPKYSGYSINNRACSQAFHCDFACFAMEFNVLRYFIRIYCIFCTFRCILTFCCPLLNFQSPPPFFNIYFRAFYAISSFVFCIFIHFQHLLLSLNIFYIYSFIYFFLLYIYIYIYIEYSTHSTHAWYIFCSFILHFRTVLYILSNL